MSRGATTPQDAPAAPSLAALLRLAWQSWQEPREQAFTWPPRETSGAPGSGPRLAH